MASEMDIPLPAFLPEEPAPSAPAAPAVPAAAATAATAADTPDPATQAPEPQAAFDQHLTARLQAHENEQRAHWLQQVEQWREEVARDPHLGGDNLSASVARAQLALDRFDQDKRIGRLLEQSGYGNHPEVIRFFNRMADALMEDNPALGQPSDGMLPLEERMYAGWSSRD